MFQVFFFAYQHIQYYFCTLFNNIKSEEILKMKNEKDTKKPVQAHADTHSPQNKIIITYILCQITMHCKTFVYVEY